MTELLSKDLKIKKDDILMINLLVGRKFGWNAACVESVLKDGLVSIKEIKNELGFSSQNIVAQIKKLQKGGVIDYKVIHPGYYYITCKPIEVEV